jgi:hypothetical protein
LEPTPEIDSDFAARISDAIDASKEVCPRLAQPQDAASLP